MKSHSLLALAGLAFAACSTAPTPNVANDAPRAAVAAPVSLPANVSFSEAGWYSEQVKLSGRLFTPASASASAKAPAVVLAPAYGETADTLDAYAAELAAQGIVALAVDYRGWGRSGAELYLGERVSTYDAQRFSEHTADVIYRRGRIDPEQQVQDLRNAITYLQSLPNVDRAKIGVAGLGLGGGHVISVMAMDARAKVGVAITPDIPGQGEEEKSFVPDAKTQAEMIKLAREGAPPRTASATKARNEQENRLMGGEYKPFWRLDAIPQTAAVRFIIAENDTSARPAAKELKGANDVKVIAKAGAKLDAAQTSEAAKLTAEWLKQKL
ncbi:MAG TPA: alpha/beta fold hydrolase [Hyphomonadaceae bacterium]|jgi:dienelactone hydrolase|nr:alpha/beta fold hydrolase [Hyphomonadaceae bacterium]